MNLPDSDTTEQAILAVLTGTPIAEAADRAQTSSAHLVAATERYREAGRAALEIRGASSGWLQANIEFADYSNAERIFLTHFLPPLWQAAQSGTIGGWWFVRKYPCWRLRAIPGPRSNTDRLSRETSQLLDLAASESGVERWWTSPYEPETTAFGGPEGMNIAHSLFHTDSLGALHYLHYVSEDGKRFLDAKATSLLLICLFLRAANQEWSEQGDVWARVEAARPLPDDVQVDRVTAMAPALHKLLTADAAPSLAASGPLAPVADWATGMERGGRLLGQAGRAGQLRLGTRGILARHVRFHWNRMGFTTRQQAIWARAARQTILDV